MSRVIVRPGDIVTIEVPYSEACMDLRVAGKRLQVRIGAGPHERGSAFIIDENGREYPPVLLSEACIHPDERRCSHARHR